MNSRDIVNLYDETGGCGHAPNRTYDAAHAAEAHRRRRRMTAGHGRGADEQRVVGLRGEKSDAARGCVTDGQALPRMGERLRAGPIFLVAGLRAAGGHGLFPKMPQTSSAPRPTVSRAGIHIQPSPPIQAVPVMPPPILPPCHYSAAEEHEQCDDDDKCDDEGPVGVSAHETRLRLDRIDPATPRCLTGASSSSGRW